MRHVPPFVIKGEDGTWSGITVELWERIASQLELPYTFIEAELHEMVNGLSNGRFDAGVAALTMTGDRESKVDFMHPRIKVKSYPTSLDAMKSVADGSVDRETLKVSAICFVAIPRSYARNTRSRRSWEYGVAIHRLLPAQSLGWEGTYKPARHRATLICAERATSVVKGLLLIGQLMEYQSSDG